MQKFLKKLQLMLKKLLHLENTTENMGLKWNCKIGRIHNF